MPHNLWAVLLYLYLFQFTGLCWNMYLFHSAIFAQMTNWLVVESVTSRFLILLWWTSAFSTAFVKIKIYQRCRMNFRYSLQLAFCSFPWQMELFFSFIGWMDWSAFTSWNSMVWTLYWLYYLLLMLMICRLDGVRLENGKINVVNRKNGNKLKFNQKKW